MRPFLLTLFIGLFVLGWGATVFSKAPDLGATGSPGEATAGEAPHALVPNECSWAVVPSPSLWTFGNALYDVAAAAANDVWAVGEGFNGTNRLPLIQHWNGSQWTIVPAPASTTGGTLRDVVAVAANNVWAVGWTGANPPQPLTLHWNGILWSVAPAPTLAAGGLLYGVSALAATDIWAVGNTQTYPFQTLVLHWNGSAWSTVPSPSVGTESNFLNAVSARAANDAWAVGYTSIGSNNQAIILHWNGTQWSVVPGPATDTVLNGVAASAANDAWAVGRDASGPVIEHWNGQAWTVYPYPAGALGELDDILALGSNDLWAVGTIRGGSGWNTLALHWDGIAWTRIASANNNDINVLQGVGAVTAEDLWAVGVSAFSGPMTGSGSDAPRGKDGAFPQGGQGVLTEHYVCALPSPTATPTRTPHAGQFEDVPPGSTFYEFVECMGTRGIISGYPCGGPFEPCYTPPKPYFRPNNNVTRGQVSKMVASAAGWNDPVPSTQQTFEDVPPGSTFWLWIEQLAGRRIIGGYPCGGPFEPCVAPTNRPYFRPNNNLTRGQLAKIDATAAGFTETPTGQTFQDVPPGSTFYLPIERIAGRGIVGGYPCGGPFEPCVPPDNRPYYRPNNNVTRGQIAKIVTDTFFPNCQTPTTPTATPVVTPSPTETPSQTGTPGPTVTVTPAP